MTTKKKFEFTEEHFDALLLALQHVSMGGGQEEPHGFEALVMAIGGAVKPYSGYSPYEGGGLRGDLQELTAAVNRVAEAIENKE